MGVKSKHKGKQLSHIDNEPTEIGKKHGFQCIIDVCVLITRQSKVFVSIITTGVAVISSDDTPMTFGDYL